MENIISALSLELKQKEEYVKNVVELLDEGNTIPFIARYRKELHGSMDDTTLRTLETRLQYLRNLAARKEEIIRSIEGQGKLTEELQAQILAAVTLAEAEDLYRAFGKAYQKFPDTWKLYLLSSHTEFERTFGKQADKKRKLYNGMLKCDLFMFGVK